VGLHLTAPTLSNGPSRQAAPAELNRHPCRKRVCSLCFFASGLARAGQEGSSGNHGQASRFFPGLGRWRGSQGPPGPGTRRQTALRCQMLPPGDPREGRPAAVPSTSRRTPSGGKGRGAPVSAFARRPAGPLIPQCRSLCGHLPSAGDARQAGFPPRAGETHFPGGWPYYLHLC